MPAKDWSALCFEAPTRGECEACGLPHWNSNEAYRLPRQRGWFCSIRCMESVIFGHGHCGWCGDDIDGRTDRRYCGDGCRRRSAGIPFGNGARLLHFISVHHPQLYRVLSAASCARCGDPLVDKRQDAKFCSVRCRVAANRRRLEPSGKPKTSVTRSKRNSNLRGTLVSNEQSVEGAR